jgi:AcrR family transcriptional regulator
VKSTRRGYTSPSRTRQARETHTRILAAATDLFVSPGYAATSVGSVAQRAGVSAQTVYNAFGTKRALLKAAYDVALAGDHDPVPLVERPEVRRIYAMDDATDFLHAYAALGRGVLDRVGALMLQIAAGAAAGDPDLVVLQQSTDEERLVGTFFVARRVQELGALAPSLTVERARDRVWTLNSVGVWHLLIAGRGWSGEEYVTWIGEQMCAALLDE